MEDVLLDGVSNVNIIIEDLRKKIKLPISKLAPYTLRMVNQTSRVDPRLENSYPWYFVCRHLNSDEKQCIGRQLPHVVELSMATKCQGHAQLGE